MEIISKKQTKVEGGINDLHNGVSPDVIKL